MSISENSSIIAAYYDMEDDVLTWNVSDTSLWKGSSSIVRLRHIRMKP